MFTGRVRVCVCVYGHTWNNSDGNNMHLYLYKITSDSNNTLKNSTIMFKEIKKKTEIRDANIPCNSSTPSYTHAHCNIHVYIHDIHYYHIYITLASSCEVLLQEIKEILKNITRRSVSLQDLENKSFHSNKNSKLKTFTSSHNNPNIQEIYK